MTRNGLVIPVGQEREKTPKESWGLRAYLTIPALYWLVIWLGINSGPWVLSDTPDTLLGFLHWVRTAGPLAVLFICLLARPPLGIRGTMPASWPARFWIGYALIGTIAGWFGPEPIDATYWTLSFLAGFAVIQSCAGRADQVQQMARLNHLTWLITAAFAIILVAVARDALFADPTSGYGALGRMDEVGDMPMSRASGMARFIGVPGLAAFGLVFAYKGWRRWLWAIVAAGSAYFVYFMQSRGSIFGFAAAFGFVLAFAGRRHNAIKGLTWFVLILLITLNPGGWVESFESHVRREASAEDLYSMTGRTRDWEHAWVEIWKSPIWGWGAQADRALIGQHVHNTYLYALLESGFLGAGLFVAGLIWAWVALIRAMWDGTARRRGHETFILQCGAILTFFTVRSIPEVCGPMFGVDFMIMAPIIAYLGYLDRVPRPAPASRPARLSAKHRPHSPIATAGSTYFPGAPCTLFALAPLSPAGAHKPKQ